MGSNDRIRDGDDGKEYDDHGPIDRYNIERFKEMHREWFDIAKSEIDNGRKESHWIWFIFPQMKGLGTSEKSNYYGISGIREARAYFDDEYLHFNTLRILRSLLSHKAKDIGEIMGGVDAIKLRSSMTLFKLSTDHMAFQEVLDAFYDGKEDDITRKMIEAEIERAHQRYTGQFDIVELKDISRPVRISYDYSDFGDCREEYTVDLIDRTIEGYFHSGVIIGDLTDEEIEDLMDILEHSSCLVRKDPWTVCDYRNSWSITTDGGDCIEIDADSNIAYKGAADLIQYLIDLCARNSAFEDW